MPPTAWAGNRKILVIGDYPDYVEEDHGYVFCGTAGNLLDRTLRDLGASIKQCYLTNLYPHRVNHKSQIRPDALARGTSGVLSAFKSYAPNIVLLLGEMALQSFKAGADIEGWRGSLFLQADGPFAGAKCLATFHPRDVLAAYETFPLFQFDVRRVVEEGTSNTLVVPSRELYTNLGTGELIRLMNEWPSGQRCSIDIEGGLPEDCVNSAVKADSKRRKYIGWRCVSIAGRTTRAFTITWSRFNEADRCAVMRSFARLMRRSDVPKVLQNSLYDNFVLSYGYAIPITPVIEDTMLKGWEIYCELPKGLATQASIWTREPHWKDDDMYQSDGEGLAQGCAKDSAVTLEICEAQDGALNPLARAHYRANMDLLNPVLFMELRGMAYDRESVARQRSEIQTEFDSLGNELCESAGTELRGPKGSLSSKRLAEHLYVKAHYPPQYKKEHGRKTNKFTTDVEALLTLSKRLPGDKFLAGILRHRHLEGFLETLSIHPDHDGRVRCGYNVVGTETGRLTCYTSPTGAGANLTTITKKLRKNYVADPGYDFFQCDLSGADGWTVAAHCAALGDPTMFNDYVAGLKPAKIIALLYAFGPEVNRLDTESLLFWSSDRVFRLVSDSVGSWVYDGSKVVQHGTNYGMGIPTMQSNLLKQSFKKSGKPVYLEHAAGALLQRLYLQRYHGVPVWHRWAESELVNRGSLTSASGHTREFFGRKFGTALRDTVKQFLADEPQQNTTWATNLAMLNLWKDPANRVQSFLGRVITTCDGGQHLVPVEAMPQLSRLGPGSLLIEPLHQVHDALCGQWPQFLRDWARKKVKSYFNNTLTIAKTNLVIPFEGAYGPSWGDQPHQL